MRIEPVIRLNIQNIALRGVKELIGISSRKLEFRLPADTISVGTTNRDRGANIQIPEDRAIVGKPGWGVVRELPPQPQSAVSQQIVPGIGGLIFQRGSH